MDPGLHLLRVSVPLFLRQMRYWVRKGTVKHHDMQARGPALLVGFPMLCFSKILEK